MSRWVVGIVFGLLLVGVLGFAALKAMGRYVQFTVTDVR